MTDLAPSEAASRSRRLVSHFVGWIMAIVLSSVSARAPIHLRILMTDLFYVLITQGKTGQWLVQGGGTRLAARCSGANP
jgi:hypothetical protein